MPEIANQDWIELPITLESSLTADAVLEKMQVFEWRTHVPLAIGAAGQTAHVVYFIQNAQSSSESRVAIEALHDARRVAMEMVILAEFYERVGTLLSQVLYLWDDPSSSDFDTGFSLDPDRGMLWPTSEYLSNLMDIGAASNPARQLQERFRERFGDYSEVTSFDITEIALNSPLKTKARIRVKKSRRTKRNEKDALKTTSKFSSKHATLLCALVAAICAIPSAVETAVHPNPQFQVEMQRERFSDQEVLIRQYVDQMEAESKKGRCHTMQTLLSGTGYDPGKYDGYWGPNTERAAKRFVADHAALAQNTGAHTKQFYRELARAYVDSHFS